MDKEKLKSGNGPRKKWRLRSGSGMADPQRAVAYHWKLRAICDCDSRDFQSYLTIDKMSLNARKHSHKVVLVL